MKRKTKRRLKKAVILGIPVIILCVISYVALASFSEASETFSYEHYYGDESSDKSGEYDGTKQGDDTMNLPTAKKDKSNPDSIAVLVNKELPLPTGYSPKDLVVPDVLFQITYFDEKKQMRSEAAKALEKLFDGAQKEGITLCAVSGYRSYQRQYDIFTANIRKQGLEHTMQFSAKPGYSEHQTGLSIDVSSESVKYRLDATFGDTTEGKWLAENAYLYGYIIRYPEDKTEITGYAYEPWHIRYVGKNFARYLHKKQLTLEEYYGFKPSIDYANEITYDNLVDIGIDMEDIIEQTEPATQASEEAATKPSETEESTGIDPATKETTAADSKTGTHSNTKETQPATDVSQPANHGGNTGNTSSGNGTEATTPATEPTGTTTEETVPGSNGGTTPESGANTPS